MFERRLAEINARKVEIRGLLEGEGQVDLAQLETELKALEKEEQELRRRQEMAAGIQAGTVTTRTVASTKQDGLEGRQANEAEIAEKRGQALKENRAVTVGAANVILPRHDATDIRPTFNEVSGLVDRVHSMVMIGGESFRQPYVKGYGTGNYADETGDYADAEPLFDYAAINKSKITAYAEDTEELLKLPAAPYSAEVIKGITIAARKRITREILVGTGATNRLAGIFSAAATAINADTDLTITEINETTLDEIIYSFGGDEDVEDAAVLILNKKDLKTFALLRDAEGRKIHDVKSQGNTGTIDGIPFLINSACKALSDPASADGDYAMAYGPLSNYCLCIFSEMDVQRSTDYKFKQGMVAHRGSVFLGGNVASKNGFLRVKKGA